MKLTIKQTKFFDTLFDNNYKIRIDSPYDEYYMFGGFGAAKSRCIMTAVNIICLQYPNSHGVYIRGTFPELKDSVIPQYLSNNPPETNKYTYNKSDREITYFNNTRLDFRAFDKDLKILSNEYDFVVFCQMEELNEELFLASLGRNRRRVGGLPRNITLGEGNPAGGWCKTKLKDNPLAPNVYLIEVKTKDNEINLPPGYEAKLRKDYPEFWVARYVDGEWSNIDEMVYSEFRETRDVIDPIDFRFIKGLRQRGGFDYGWRTDSAFNWSFVDYDGNVVVFDEYYAPQMTADEIVNISCRYTYELPNMGKKQKTLFVADYAIKRPDRDGRNLWDELAGKGMNLTECSKDEMNSISLVNSMFKQGRLKVTRNCTNTIKQMLNWKWKKVKLGTDKNAPDEPIDKDNHHCDNVNYIVSNLEGTMTVNPSVNDYKKSLEYANIRRANQVQAVS